MKLWIRSLLVSFSLVITGCGGGESASKGPSKTLIYAIGSDAQKLDPADVDDGESVKTLNQIREGVVSHDGTPLNAEIAAWSFDRQMYKDHPGHLRGAGIHPPSE